MASALATAWTGSSPAEIAASLIAISISSVVTVPGGNVVVGEVEAEAEDGDEEGPIADRRLAKLRLLGVR